MLGQDLLRQLWIIINEPPRHYATNPNTRNSRKRTSKLVLLVARVFEVSLPPNYFQYVPMKKDCV